MMWRHWLVAYGASVAVFVAIAWTGGAIYLMWAGLDPGRAGPMTLWRYWRAYGDRPGESLRLAVSVLAPMVGAALFAIALLTAPGRHIHGRGRWGNRVDLARLKLDAPSGLILGEAFGGFVRYGDEAHVLVVAPTGAGKTTGIVLPNLLSWTGSVVTLDPRREAWNTTAGYRALFGQVFLWAPLDARGRTCRFNPLDQILDDKASRVADLMRIAAALAPKPGNANDWIAENAQRLLCALSLYVIDALPRVQRCCWRRGRRHSRSRSRDGLKVYCSGRAVFRRRTCRHCPGSRRFFLSAPGQVRQAGAEDLRPRVPRLSKRIN